MHTLKLQKQIGFLMTNMGYYAPNRVPGKGARVCPTPKKCSINHPVNKNIAYITLIIWLYLIKMGWCCSFRIHCNSRIARTNHIKANCKLNYAHALFNTI